MSGDRELQQHYLDHAFDADLPAREALKAQIERWNDLIFKLCELAKPGGEYEGETAEELVAMIEACLS
jgi:hypothetical protein